MPSEIDERRDQAVHHHPAHARRRLACAVREHREVILDEMRSRRQRHRRGKDFLHRPCRRDQRDVHREGHDRHPEDQHHVARERQERAMLDHALARSPGPREEQHPGEHGQAHARLALGTHQYWTFRST